MMVSMFYSLLSIGNPEEGREVLLMAKMTMKRSIASKNECGAIVSRNFFSISEWKVSLCCVN